MPSTSKQSLSDRAAAKWAEMRPWALGLGIGLVAGPIISAVVGFQVRTSTAQAATRAGVVEQQANFCAERARAAHAATGATGTMDWQKRSDLARAWATMPGETASDPDVVFACSSQLGR